MLPACRVPAFEKPVPRVMAKVSFPAPGSALSWTVIVKLVAMLLLVPVPLKVTVLPLKMAEVMRPVVKSTPPAVSW